MGIWHVTLPKRPNNQFKTVWQRQALRDYRPNIYTVIVQQEKQGDSELYSIWFLVDFPDSSVSKWIDKGFQATEGLMYVYGNCMIYKNNRKFLCLETFMSFGGKV